MFELMILAFVLIFGGVFILKVLFFLLGLVFTGVGFFLKVILTVVFGVLLFPIGAAVLGVLFSSGFFFVLVVLMGIGALLGERKRPRHRDSGYREHHYR